MTQSTSPQQHNDSQDAFFSELSSFELLPTVKLVHGVVFGSLGALAQRTCAPEIAVQEGAQRAVSFLRESAGYELPDDFWRSVLDAFEFAEQKSSEEIEEHTADDVLRFLLQFQNLGKLDQSLIEGAVDEFYAPQVESWQLAPNTEQVLAALKQAGFHVGVVENHACDRAFQRIIDRLGLRPLLDLSVTSAAVEYRKPDRHIYEIALNAWDIFPYELIVAGTHPIYDIAPAIELGALTIFLRQQVDDEATGGLYSRNDMRFDAEVDELTQIPDLVMKWALP